MTTCSLLLAATLYLLLKGHLVDAENELNRNVTTYYLSYCLTDNATGSDVVDEALKKIQSSHLFCDDNQFLFRLALVESLFGNDIAASEWYSSGGIWRVNETFLLATQNDTAHPNLAQLFWKLDCVFEIEWPTVEMEDLAKPLYSALAARIYLWTLPDPIPLESNIEGQAYYWQKHYRPNKNQSDFVDLAEDVYTEDDPDDCPLIRGMDLVFVLDASHSLRIDLNFENELNFTVNITSRFKIGPEATQIGLITFSNDAKSEFHLNTFNDNESVKAAILNATFLNNFTNTPAALEMLIDEFNNANNGARPIEEAIPRVAIVITDGKSTLNEGYLFDATVANAKKVHNENIITFAIGVGHDTINETELEAIASRPGYVYMMDGFSDEDQDDILKSICNEACKAPVMGGTEENYNISLELGQYAYFTFKIPPEGITMKFVVDNGTVTVYVSNNARNPDEDDHWLERVMNNTQDWYITQEEFWVCAAPDDNSDRRSLRAATHQETMDTRDSNIAMYVSVRGSEAMNHFTLDATYGDTREKEEAGSTTATTASIESSSAIPLLWAVVGGTLLIGSIILIAIIVIAKKSKRFAIHPQKISKGTPYEALISMEDMDDDKT